MLFASDTRVITDGIQSSRFGKLCVGLFCVAIKGAG